MTQLAEVVITDQQAALLGAAADVAIRADAGGDYIALQDGEREALKHLAVFMAAVSDNPRAFPPRPAVARSIRKRINAIKGPAQPRRKNKRNKRRASA